MIYCIMFSAALVNALQSNFRQYAILKISVNKNNPDLTNVYKTHVDNHNRSLFSDPFPNSGFDLFVPETIEVDTVKTTMISMDVKCEMVNNDNVSCGYFMFPRSSISKTPLMLANHTGVIDSGYRGNLIGAFRNLFADPFKVEKHTRLLQICHPSLCPLYVVLVNEEELSTTSRGEGGFGSTGL